MNQTKIISAAWHDISCGEEYAEVVQFLFQCIFNDATCDAPLGDHAMLQPKSLARRENGTIIAVLCNVPPPRSQEDPALDDHLEPLLRQQIYIDLS